MGLSQIAQLEQSHREISGDQNTYDHYPIFKKNHKGKLIEMISAATSTSDFNYTVMEHHKISSSFSILNFSDEILLEILANLDTLSLISLSQTCQRLHFLVQDHKLWQYIDLTGEQLLYEDIKKNLALMNPKTKTIKIRGMVERYPRESWRNVSLNKNLLQYISGACENLQVLELHHCLIDTMTKRNEFFMQIDITYFPRNLKRLIFNDCYVCWPNTLAFLFCGIDNHLKSLEDLRIEFCNWFSAHDLLSFSKIANLKRLSIRGCSELKEFVPYGNIAIRFGFKNLELLDLRETPINDTDFSYFNKLKNLHELLVECPAEPRLKLENSELNAGLVVNSMYNNNGINAEDDAIENSEAQNIISENNAEQPAIVITSDMMSNDNLNESEIVHQQTETDSFELFHSSGIFVSLPKLSDRGVCSYGISRLANGTTYIDTGCHNDTSNICCTALQRLTLRHYSNVSDISLRHLSLCAPKLKYLDVTGCGVTVDGLKAFKNLNSECKIVSHLEKL